jgi:hypothetical protein
MRMKQLRIALVAPLSPAEVDVCGKCCCGQVVQLIVWNPHLHSKCSSHTQTVARHIRGFAAMKGALSCMLGNALHKQASKQANDPLMYASRGQLKGRAVFCLIHYRSLCRDV